MKESRCREGKMAYQTGDENMSNELNQFNTTLYGAIRQVLESARKSAYKAVNFAMVQGIMANRPAYRGG